MNVVALILACIAVFIFVCTHFGVSRRWATAPLGLAFFAGALIVQFVWPTHLVTIH